MKKAKGHNDASSEAKESCHQREAAAHRLEQAIEEKCHNEIAHGRDNVGEITRDSKPAAHQELGEDCRQKVKQIKCAGHSGPGTPPRFSNPLIHLTASGRAMSGKRLYALADSHLLPHSRRVTRQCCRSIKSSQTLRVATMRSNPANCATNIAALPSANGISLETGFEK